MRANIGSSSTGRWGAAVVWRLRLAVGFGDSRSDAIHRGRTRILTDFPANSISSHVFPLIFPLVRRRHSPIHGRLTPAELPLRGGRDSNIPPTPTVSTRSFAAAIRLDASILIVIRRIRQRLSRSLKISLRFAVGLISRSWPAKETGFGPHAIQIPQPKRSTTSELADHGSGTRRNGYSLSRARKVVVN